MSNLANTKVKREVLVAFINFSPLPVIQTPQLSLIAADLCLCGGEFYTAKEEEEKPPPQRDTNFPPQNHTSGSITAVLPMVICWT